MAFTMELTEASQVSPLALTNFTLTPGTSGREIDLTVNFTDSDAGTVTAYIALGTTAAAPSDFATKLEISTTGITEFANYPGLSTGDVIDIAALTNYFTSERVYLMVSDGISDSVLMDLAVLLRPQATGGADLDLSYVEGTPTVNQDLLANWTLNGNTMSLVSVLPAVSSGFAVSSAGVLTRTGTLAVTADATHTITMEDEHGRETSDTFTLEVTAASVAPTLDTFTYTDNNDGTPGVVDSTHSGDVTGYNLQLESLNAGSGVVETTTVALGPGVAITGFTTASSDPSASPAGTGTQLRGTLVGPNGDSNSITVAAAGMDFGINGITWATNAAGTQIIGTSPSDTLYFTQDVADWAISGVAAGAPTIDSVTGNGTTAITLNMSGNLPQNGETLTLAYTNTDTDLRDQDGSPAADFAGTSVTNNVPSASATFETVDQGSGSPFLTWSSNTTTRTFSISAGAADAALEAVVAIVTYDARGTPNVPIVKEDDALGADLTVVTDGTTPMDYQVANRCGLAMYSLAIPSGTTADIFVQFDANMSRIGMFVLRKVGGAFKVIDRDVLGTSPNTTDFAVSGAVVNGDTTFAIGNYRSASVGMTGISGAVAYGPEGDAQGEYAIQGETSSATRNIGETVNDTGQLNMVVVG